MLAECGFCDTLSVDDKTGCESHAYMRPFSVQHSEAHNVNAYTAEFFHTDAFCMITADQNNHWYYCPCYCCALEPQPMSLSSAALRSKHALLTLAAQGLLTAPWTLWYIISWSSDVLRPPPHQSLVHLMVHADHVPYILVLIHHVGHTIWSST